METTPTAAAGRKRREYLVTLDTFDDAGQRAGEREVRVEVRGADQLRGELEASKAGLPDARKAPVNQVSAWVWCALVRAHGYGESYQTFRNRDLVDFVNLKEAEEEGLIAADPTQPADTSTSASPSLATSAEGPPTGSTPTSTTG